jgi:hypothetical protein
VDYSNFKSASCFPKGPSINGIERTFHALNLKAFSSSQHTRVDDILIQALFSTKRHPHSYRALHPTIDENDTGLTNNDANTISKIIELDINYDPQPKIVQIGANEVK